jgi:uncharacterized membrane protein YkvA (DUF1232 family)
MVNPVKHIGFIREAAAVSVALFDRRTSWPAKVLSAGALLYLFDPFDLIPDLIPLLGWLDDAVLAPVALLLATRFIPRAVMEDARQRFAKKAK